MDDVEDDEFEPLECVRLPVAIEAYDVDVVLPAETMGTPRWIS
jgi:hypothetical protein